MTIWMRLGRLLPRNREDKWPLPVQFLVFVLFQALFICGTYQASDLLYGPTVYNWALDTFGILHADNVLTLLTMLISAEVCAWHIGLQRYITFGGHTHRRWTILPITLGYLALHLISWLLPLLLADVALPRPTDNLIFYTVLHSILYVGIVAVFCALIHALRRKEKSLAGRLAAGTAGLVLLLALCSAWTMQIQGGLFEETYTEPTPVTVTTFNVSEEGTITTFTTEDEATDELLRMLLSYSGIDAEDAVIVGPGEALSSALTDPFAAYEEAMAPAIRLGDILQWVQLIPIFFAMKRWLFARETTPKEAAA